VAISEPKIQYLETKDMYIYEKAGNLNMVIGHWDLITFINITELVKEFDFLEYDYNKFKELCQNATKILDGVTPQCIIATELVERDLRMMRERNTLLEGTVDFQHRQVRSKRGLVNFGGTIQKFLYGSMDNGDRLYYDRQLKNLEKNENTLKVDLQQQITIIKSIYQLANESYTELNGNLNEIENKMENITAYMERLWDTGNDVKLNTLIDSILANILIMKTDIMKKQDIIFHLLASPSAPSLAHILTPSMFTKEMQRIETSLTSGYRLPFPATDSYTFQTYRLCRTKLSKFKDSIACKIKIPLIQSERYELFKITPVPQFQGSKILLPEKPSEFIAVGNTTYSEFTDKEIANSDNIDGDVYYAHAKSSKKLKTETSCGLYHFTKNPINKPCPLINIEIKEELWIKLLAPRVWLFLTKRETRIQISCPGETEQEITLNRTGLIEVPNKCLILTNYTIIHPNMEAETQVISSFVLSIDDIKQSIAYKEPNNPVRLMAKTAKFRQHTVFSDLSEKLENLSEIKLIDVEDHVDPSPLDIFASFHAIYKTATVILVVMVALCIGRPIIKCVVYPCKSIYKVIKCCTRPSRTRQRKQKTKANESAKGEARDVNMDVIDRAVTEQPRGPTPQTGESTTCKTIKATEKKEPTYQRFFV
jgi:hypothetical protein